MIDFVNTHGQNSYDPYDGLTSPIPHAVLGNRQGLLRLWQAMIGRSPLNLRPLLGIKPLLHTKTMSDFISAYSLLCLRERRVEYVEGIESLCESLLKVSVEGSRGRGWGLRFPLATRFVVAGNQTCNAFNTLNAVQCLVDAYVALGLSEYLDLALKGFSYLEHEIGYRESGDCLAWNYWRGLDAEIHNINGLMLGLCSRLHDITGEQNYERFAQKLHAALARAQNANGSWYYSDSKNGRWVDGFHTGYILEGFSRAVAAGIIEENDPCFRKGITFYLSMMFTAEQMPKYYADSVYPIDAQNAAQAIQTSAFLASIGLNPLSHTFQIFSAVDNALWNPRGYYNVQKTKFWTVTTPMHRWATGPMLLALVLTKHLAETR